MVNLKYADEVAWMMREKQWKQYAHLKNLVDNPVAVIVDDEIVSVHARYELAEAKARKYANH